MNRGNEISWSHSNGIRGRISSAIISVGILLATSAAALALALAFALDLRRCFLSAAALALALALDLRRSSPPAITVCVVIEV